MSDIHADEHTRRRAAYWLLAHEVEDGQLSPELFDALFPSPEALPLRHASGGRLLSDDEDPIPS